MLNITFEKTHLERIGDTNNTIRSMSYNCPGHQDRLEAHSERVQRDYFDSGLYYRETHKAQEKPKLIRDRRSRD